MAKVVRWKGEFPDIDGNQYTVEIYGESTGVAVKSITLGSNPLVTNEDDNDDLFTPIRTQTGTLEVLDPDGTLMEEMLPANSLDHPVIVKKGSVVVWQGFLSCEAYSQDYTARQQVVEFNLIDVLEAMRHMTMEYDNRISFCPISRVIAYIIACFNSNIGIDMVSGIYVDDMWGYGFGKGVFYYPFFENKEDMVDDLYVLRQEGISMYDAMVKISEYFGCTIRFAKEQLYFAPADMNGKAWRWFYVTYSSLVSHLNGADWERTFGNAVTAEIGDMFWMGKDHSKTVMIGTKSVKVTAEAGDFEKLMELPELNMTAIVENSDKSRGDVAVGTNSVYDSNHVSLRGGYDVIHAPSPYKSGTEWQYPQISIDTHSTLTGNRYNETIFFGNNRDNARGRVKSTGTWVVGGPGLDSLACGYAAGDFSIISAAFFAGYTHENIWNGADVRTSKTGLVIMGTPEKFYCKPQDEAPFVRSSIDSFRPSATNYLYRQKSYRSIKASSGWLNIDINICHFLCSTVNITGCSGLASKFDKDKVKMCIAVQFAGKYWNETDKVWQSSFTSFYIDFDEGGGVSTNKTSRMQVEKDNGFFIPITSNMEGDVCIYIYKRIQGCTVGDGNYVTLFDGFILDKLDVTHEPVEPRVYKHMKNEFYSPQYNIGSDKVEKTLSLTTNYRNKYAPNMLYDNESTPTTTVQLGDGIGEMVRPEKHLLGRLVSWYAVSRRVLSVEVKALNTALPVTLVTESGKRFVPVESEHDWKLGRSTLKLIETV